MGLSDITNFFFPEPTIEDVVTYAPEYAPEIKDVVICVARDSNGTVEGVGFPYADDIERWYVVAEDGTWADWLTIYELF